MKIPRVLAALVTAAMVALPVVVIHAASDQAIVHATDQPTIVPPIAFTQDCAGDRVCVTLTVANPVAGTITLKLTGHTPASSDFVDTGAELRLTIVPGTTTYTGCFEKVSSFIEPDFNTLRVEVKSSDILNLQGTETKSKSFPPCSSTSPSPTPTPSGTPTPPQSPTPTPPQSPTPTPPQSPTPTPPHSPTPTAPAPPTATPGGGGGLAQTGGFQFGFALAGLVLLVAGLSVLGVSRARSKSTQP